MSVRTVLPLHVLLPALAAVLIGAAGAAAQEDAAAAGSFPYHRKVDLPTRTAPPPVVVTEFFTHGALRADGKNLVVRDASRQLVPWRALQVGPGDFCRVAFQTSPKQYQYRIEYGGEDTSKTSPKWVSDVGLLFESRHWKGCDLNDLSSVRGAFEKAAPIGADYVAAVYHRLNPVAPASGRFMSMYRGTLRAPGAGNYAFFTTSQDASFLLIDGKLVTSNPGRHGPVRDARHKGEITLTAGPHDFEYVHAAAGPNTCMVAAWQTPRGSKPEPIPPAAFGAEEVAHVSAIGPFNANDRALRDFVFQAVDEVPLTESDQTMIRVQFQLASGHSASAATRLRWDFGDGQTSTAASPTHIYLHPGLYTVRAAPSDAAGLAAVNRVQIDRPLLLENSNRSPDQLAAYLKVFDTYDPLKLDPEGLLQLVRAYEQGSQLAKAAKIGLAWLTTEPPPKDEVAISGLTTLIGPMFRDRLDDPESALAVFQAAAKASRHDSYKVRYLAAAADIALNDLLQLEPAQTLIRAAEASQAKAPDPAAGILLDRVQGDAFSRRGDREKALDAYARAAAARNRGRSSIEQDAWRGAHSRSTEAFLRDKEFDRALAELRAWQEEFPADRIEGYLPLLQARYWAARGKFANAIALANDLVAIAPDSSYADRLLFLAAECEEKQGQIERARVSYKSLITDYPGSPLVTDANQRLAELAAKAEKK